MTRIPDEDRDLIEQAIYLPLALTVLTRDLTTIENSPFKLKKPYIRLIDETMRRIQNELAYVKKMLHKKKIKVSQIMRDDAFTTYEFLYKGFTEEHKYFNPRIRNHVQQLIEMYFLTSDEKQPLKE